MVRLFLSGRTQKDPIFFFKQIIAPRAISSSAKPNAKTSLRVGHFRGGSQRIKSPGWVRRLTTPDGQMPRLFKGSVLFIEHYYLRGVQRDLNDHSVEIQVSLTEICLYDKL